jgi:hypothetical protein
VVTVFYCLNACNATFLQAFFVMQLLQKVNLTPPPLPLAKRFNRQNIAENVFLLDEKNHQRWQKIINDYSKNKDFSLEQCITNLIGWGKLPSDYRQRHIMRLLAQGITLPASTLEHYEIVLYDSSPRIIERLKPNNRQPQSPFDFVCVDVANWQQYSNLQRFYDFLPARPYCSMAKDGKALILDKSKAVNLPYLQPNHPLFANSLVFDVDEKAGRSAFTAWQDCNLPPPNLIIKNPYKDSCHYVYFLSAGVALTDRNEKARRYLSAIYTCLCELLDADPNYSGQRMKNPLSRKHDVFVSGADCYTLAQLADKLDLDEIPPKPKKAKETPQAGYIGRNCSLFDYLRHIAYQNANNMSFDSLMYYLLSLGEQYNNDCFTHNPLPSNELGHICNSIARFCKSAKFGKYSANFIEKQRHRGTLGDSSKGGLARSHSYNEQREHAKAMFATGAKISAIAKALGVHRNSISNWIKV